MDGSVLVIFGKRCVQRENGQCLIMRGCVCSTVRARTLTLFNKFVVLQTKVRNFITRLQTVLEYSIFFKNIASHILSKILQIKINDIVD